MSAPRRQSFWPGLVGIIGHHITQHGQSLSQWDLRIDFRDGGAITLDAVTLEQALAFIDCAHRMLIHEAPDPISDTALQADLRSGFGVSGPTKLLPRDDEPPADPSDSPRTDPPSTGPEPAAAGEPIASGGWIHPGAVTATVRAGEYLLPFLPPGGACFGGEWIVPPSGPWSSLPGRQAQFEVRFDQTAPFTAVAGRTRGKQYELDQVEPIAIDVRAGCAAATHVWPQVVHLKPGEVINITCSCQTITGGTLSDDPNCQMHHGASIVYVFDGR